MTVRVTTPELDACAFDALARELDEAAVRGRMEGRPAAQICAAVLAANHARLQAFRLRRRKPEGAPT